ncbi:MAG: hypothetical protein AM1032_000001 [Mycoplasmataceae bacterium]|nr:MAG: hypothetical protein AM1032_000001 [Mycoplasmataceae bacterium]
MIANLDLNVQTELFFNNLEKNTGLSKDKLISNILNGTDNLEDLALINYMINKEKSPEFKTYSHEEMGVLLGLV